MCAVENSNDAALRSLRAGNAAQALDFCENVIAVHGVLDCVAGNEDIAVELRHGRIGDDEAVAVVVKNEAAFDFVATRYWWGLVTLRRLLGGLLSLGLPFRLSVRGAVPSPP